MLNVLKDTVLKVLLANRSSCRDGKVMNQQGAVPDELSASCVVSSMLFELFMFIVKQQRLTFPSFPTLASFLETVCPTIALLTPDEPRKPERQTC